MVQKPKPFGAAPGNDRFIDPDRVVVADNLDVNRPFAVEAPTAAEAGQYPDVALQPELIVNRGEREVFTLSGVGFSSY